MIYRVIYQSMTSSYGPSFIEADSEYEAQRKFARSAFSAGEMALIKARPVSSAEVQRALREQQ
jgi:hypothetical protein